MNTALETPTTKPVIKIADQAHVAFPMVIIDAYAAKFNLSGEEAVLHARELTRYLAMCEVNPAAGYGMAGQVDEVWHLAILHTRAYAEWCLRAFGRFVHHDPTPPSVKAAVLAGEELDTYALFYDDYTGFFSEAPPSVWPKPAASWDCGSGCGSSGDSGSNCSSPSPSSPSPSCGSRREDKKKRR